MIKATCLWISCLVATASMVLPGPVLATKVYYEGFERGGSTPEMWNMMNMYPTTAEDAQYADWPQPPNRVGDWENGWAVGSGNWQDTGGVAGVANGNDDFIRILSPSGGKAASNGNAGDVTTHAIDGDMTADFGDKFTVTFYVKQIDTLNDSGWMNQIAGGPTGTGRWNYTVFDAGSVPADWTLVTIPFNANWSNATAEAFGWVREQGQAEDTFSAVMQNISSKGHSFGFGLPGQPAAGARGIDEIRIEFDSTIPDGAPGDFNGDGMVDAADYTVWRDNLGSTTPLDNDGGLGTPIGSVHYDLWKMNFGSTGAASVQGLDASAQVPEPATILRLLFGLTMMKLAARHR